MMGTGKTTAMIRYMGELPPERRVIFCTPFLPQIERVQAECKGRQFIAPDDEFMSKTANIKALIQAGLNIATTHALFLRFDDEIRELIREQDYTLIVDEAMDVLAAYDISAYDAMVVTTDYCDTLDDGCLVWKVPDYDGVFDEVRADIDSGVVYQHNNRTLIKMCKIESFEAFSEVFLMTYLFEDQPCKAYFDIHEWSYKQWYIAGSSHEEYQLTDTPVQYEYPDLKSLINVVHKMKRSTLKTDGGALSVAWYQEHAPAGDTEFQKLKRHMDSFFKEYGEAGVELDMWTTFREYRKNLSMTRYGSGFIACNSKATNDYRQKCVLAYPINRYLNPNLINFVNKRGAKLTHNGFALTEMIQWVWRSAIRDGQPITLYLPSDRMFRLFVQWMKSVEKR